MEAFSYKIFLKNNAGTDSVQAAQGTAQQTAGTWGVHLCLLKENVTENHLTMNGYIEC